MSFVLIAGAGCVPSIQVQVPPAVAGDIPVTLTNPTGGALCDFDMGLQHHAGGTNWLGTNKVEGGTRFSFKLKPGNYWMVANGCHDDFKEGAPRSGITVNGPTEIVLTPTNWPAKPLPPMTGYARVEIPTIMSRHFVQYWSGQGQAGPAAGPVGGGGAPAAEGEPAAEEKRECLPNGPGSPTYQVPCCSGKSYVDSSSDHPRTVCCDPNQDNGLHTCS